MHPRPWQVHRSHGAGPFNGREALSTTLLTRSRYSVTLHDKPPRWLQGRGTPGPLVNPSAEAPSQQGKPRESSPHGG